MLFWKGLKKMYDVLSGIYDEFNKGFDYGLYLEKIFESWNLPDKGLALDCGCGTGEIIKLLSDRGYECTGIDSNSGMLAVAADKLEKSGYILKSQLYTVSSIIDTAVSIFTFLSSDNKRMADKISGCIF